MHRNNMPELLVGFAGLMLLLGLFLGWVGSISVGLGCILVASLILTTIFSLIS